MPARSRWCRCRRQRNWRRFTQTALANLRYPLLAQAKLPPRENRPAQPVPERVGEPSVFQHVIYIIKENRTYDQVLGDVTKGNGDADSVHLRRARHAQPAQARPRFRAAGQHLLLRHLERGRPQWADSAIATDYMEREFAGWPRSYPSGGDGENSPRRAGLFARGFHLGQRARARQNAARLRRIRHRRTRWKDSARKDKPHFSDCLPGIHSTARTTIAIGCEPDIESLRPYLATNTVGWDLDVPDVFRAAQFIKELKQFEAAGQLPRTWSSSGCRTITPAARNPVHRRPPRRWRTMTWRWARLSRPSATAGSGRTPASLPSRMIRKTAGTTSAATAPRPTSSAPTPNAARWSARNTIRPACCARWN